MIPDQSLTETERGLVGMVRRHPVAAYVCIAFGSTWLLAIPLITNTVPDGFHLVVSLGPTIGALVVVGVVAGKSGIRDLGRRVTDHRRIPGWRWWLASLSPVAYLALAVGTSIVVDGLPSGVDWTSSFGGEGWLTGLVGASLAFGVFEEVGWRGFLLPRLQVGRSAAAASTGVWAIWAAWHAPMFLYHFDFGPMGAIGWLVGLYFGTVFLTFLHNSSGGSLLSVMLFHVTFNLATILGGALSGMLPSAITAMIVVATIVAARKGGPADLSWRGRYTIVDPAARGR